MAAYGILPSNLPSANFFCFMIAYVWTLLHPELWKVSLSIDDYHFKAILNSFFVAQVVPEIYAKNTSFKISKMCFLLLTVYEGLPKVLKLEIRLKIFIEFVQQLPSPNPILIYLLRWKVIPWFNFYKNHGITFTKIILLLPV